MRERTVIACLAAIILAVFVSLSYRETGLQNGPSRNGWWSAGFDDPKGASFDFSLENEGSAGTFDWRISSGEAALSEGRESLAPGQKKTVRPDVATDGIKGKIVLEIRSEQDSKELYKIFP